MFPSPTTPGALNEADYEAYSYDAAGNRVSLRKRDGVTLTYLYDNLNRMTRKTVPASASGAAGYSVFYGYDLRNAQTFARFGSTSGNGITSTYDAFGRLSASTNNMGGTARTLTYRYDTGSRRDRLTFPDGVWFGYGYDPGGRLTSIADQGEAAFTGGCHGVFLACRRCSRRGSRGRSRPSRARLPSHAARRLSGSWRMRFGSAQRPLATRCTTAHRVRTKIFPSSRTSAANASASACRWPTWPITRPRR